MDVRAVLSVVAISLLTAGSQDTPHGAIEASENATQSGIPYVPPQTNTHRNCDCSALANCQKKCSAQPRLVALKLTWRSHCRGNVEISYPYQLRATSPVCFGSDVDLKIVCKERSGCKGEPEWLRGTNTEDGYHIQANGTMQERSCDSLGFKCSAEEAKADVLGQLLVYKVMTALLCCVLILLLMVRFTKPTVKALQKRLSDRRQNRWIGPTQSHSVSYHREKTIKNDREQRLSYPALERLAVFDSREPSSNRNSDCNF